MAVIGTTAFAVVVWGSILGVLLVFLYEVYAIAGDFGWFERGETRHRR